jgi:hypothetical protein
MNHYLFEKRLVRLFSPAAAGSRRPFCPLALGLLAVICFSATAPVQAGISEPDTIFYGKIINRTSGQEDVLTQGTLTWTIQRPDGSPLTLTTLLQPVNNGVYSYRLLVPHELIAYQALPGPDSVPVTSQAAACSHVAISIDGNPATILAPGSTSFAVAEALRASTHRIDLEVFNPLADTAGDGIPDWWKARYGITDANADPMGDGWSNLQAFLHGANPTNDNRIPSLLTQEAFVLAGGTTGIRLQAIDSDSAPTNLVYTILATPQAGTLYLRNSQPNPGNSDTALAVGSSFTQADIDRGRVVLAYQATGPSLTADSLSVSLHDETPSHPASTNAVALNIYSPSYPDAVMTQAQAVAPAPAGFSDIPGLTFNEQQMLLNYFLSRDHKYVIWDGTRGASHQEIRVPSSGLTAAEYASYVATYGPDHPNVLLAGAGGDYLVGGMENDILIAGRGGDTLRGNGGSDLFVIPGTVRGQATIEDFNVNEKDALDISRLLVGGSTVLSNYVQITNDGTSTRLGVSVNGSGANFADLVLTLQGVLFTQADLRNLVANGNLLTGNKALSTEVSIAATLAGASQNGPVSGEFTLTRSGSVASALTVFLQITGSAVNGNDYQYLPSQVTFAAGQRTLTLSVNPYFNSAVFTQFVQIAVLSGAGYDLGSTPVAQVSIEPLLPQISIQAISAIASRLDQSAGLFLVSRGGLINNSVLVSLSIGGTAPSGDYNSIPPFLNFAPQQTTALISVTPKPTAVLARGPETVQVTIQPSASYKLLGPFTDRIFLVDQLLSFSSWQKKYFPDSTEPAIQFAGEDSGHAGVRNVFRYAYGLNPMAPNDPSRFPAPLLADGYLALSFKRPPAITDINYLVEISDDLVNWRATSADVQQFFPPASSNDVETVFFRSLSTVNQKPSQFMRVRVQLQP